MGINIGLGKVAFHIWRFIHYAVVFFMIVNISLFAIPISLCCRLISLRKYLKWLLNCSDLNLQKLVCFLLFGFNSQRLYLYGHASWIRLKKHSLIIANHQSSGDLAIITTVLNHFNVKKNVKYLMKDVLKYIPVFGLLVTLENFILLRRDVVRDLRFIKNTIRRISSHKESYHYILFPEGHRYSRRLEKLLERSDAFCLKNKIEPYKHVLCPRTTGFKFLLDTFDEELQSIADLTLVVYDRKLKRHINGHYDFWTASWNDSYEYHVHLDFIMAEKLNHLKKNPEELYSIYRKKDEFIEEFNDEEGRNRMICQANSSFSNNPCSFLVTYMFLILIFLVLIRFTGPTNYFMATGILSFTTLVASSFI